LKSEKAERLARQEVERVLSELPHDIRRVLDDVTIIVRSSQGREERDLLGLFSGLTHVDGIPSDPEHAPTITLFTDNLLDYVNGSKDAYLQECRTTILHEIGHYLGWNEEEVESRGL